MSYKYEEVEGVRKVRWDELWHVLYRLGGRDTWDRVNKRTAMSVLRKMDKERKSSRLTH